MLAVQSTVLLVEDEPLIRLFISELLEDAGFKVVEAANAAEALVLLEAGLPVNVLLTDVDMPIGCNGFELAHKVHESWPETEILIMSGRQWPAQGDLPPGAAFLAKPPLRRRTDEALCPCRQVRPCSGRDGGEDPAISENRLNS
jgi:CheY-like chemotaxis protein